MHQGEPLAPTSAAGSAPQTSRHTGMTTCLRRGAWGGRRCCQAGRLTIARCRRARGRDRALRIVVSNMRRKGAHFYRAFADDTRQQTIMGRRHGRRWSHVRNGIVAASRRPGTAAHQQEQEGEQANQGAHGHGLTRSEFHEEPNEVIDDGPLHGILPSARCQCWRRHSPATATPRHQPGRALWQCLAIIPDHGRNFYIGQCSGTAPAVSGKIIDSGRHRGIMTAGADDMPEAWTARALEDE